MSPPRRRSARLAGATPKSKAAPTLTSVTEQRESPVKANDDVVSSPVRRAPTTPSSSAVKPPHSEMHPSKAHQTTGKPSSALRLGFADIDRTGHRAGPSTPSKTPAVPSSSFTFRVSRENADVELSSDAQKLMDELREEAAKIKAEMVAKREVEGDADGNERKIAKPKGKSSRFSAAHMAEFKKMDSIEGHASAWRAQNGRFTPVVSLKRSPSKANLDSTPTSQQKGGLKRSPSKANLETTPVSQLKQPSSRSNAEAPPTTPRLKPALKRKSSGANLDEYQQSPSPKKVAAAPALKKPEIFSNIEQRSVSNKRLKHRLEDDASAARPISRDGTQIPLPTLSASSPIKPSTAKSALTRLMSPTKASLAHTAGQGKPTISLVKSPSKPNLQSGLSKPSAASSLASTCKDLTPRARVVSPGRFEKVKSILRGHRTASGNVQTAIPQPSISQTPAPRHIEKALPPVPLTTPRRKLTKHVAFTPEVTRISVDDSSPSPQKARLGTSGSVDIALAGIDDVLSRSTSDDVTYPDLSGFKPLPKLPAQESTDSETSVPGTFTFRSDHTIEFGNSSNAFGAVAGQSSVRQVRKSLKPEAEMPGSFPVAAPASHPNKENKVPTPAKILLGAPHGMSNKKRHRATSDDDDSEEEATERAGKKRKNEHVPEGHALFAPRLFSTPSGSAKKARKAETPSRAPASASPTKKRMLSMSRLNMLARPKNRA